MMTYVGVADTAPIVELRQSIKAAIPRAVALLSDEGYGNIRDVGILALSNFARHGAF
jgi:hypothetical protein